MVRKDKLIPSSKEEKGNQSSKISNLNFIVCGRKINFWTQLGLVQVIFVLLKKLLLKLYVGNLKDFAQSGK